MELDYTLDQLPEHILEEIFTFVPKKENLRLVCKTFNNIINNSKKLMKNHWLIVDKALKVDSSTIHHHYQNLKLHYLNAEVLNWISNYQHKERIKTIRLKCHAYYILKSPNVLQYILSNFNSVETFTFVSKDFSHPQIIMEDFSDEIRLIPNKFSKLTTLNVACVLELPSNILKMMSKVPTIKNLFIHDFEYLKFPEKVEWKLEKLVVPNYVNKRIDVDNCMSFLKSQQDTLKTLVLNGSFINKADFVMRNLPNLENVTLELKENEEIDDSLLISNHRLQCLDISGIKKNNLNNLSAILNHYNRIKYLFIALSHFHPVHDSFEWKFKHVTHLALDGWNCFYLLQNDFPCLKILALGFTDSCKHPNIIPEISDRVRRNVEKLSIYLWSEKYVIDIIEKFQNVSYLNMSIYDWYTQESIAATINNVLTATPQLKCLGLEEESLSCENFSYEQLLSQINNKQINLKVYKNSTSMIAEDWGCDKTPIAWPDLGYDEVPYY